MSKIRFAIVGTGAIAPIHFEALKSARDAEVVAVYGRSAGRVQETAAKYAVDGYTDYQAMLARKDIDAVTICTPSGLHADFGIQAAKAGKHVIVEKPIEVNIEKADALISACRANNVELGVIFQRRYSDGAKALRKAITDGKLGKLLFGGCYLKLYRSQAYYDSAAWRGTWQMDGGGVLMNQGIHYIDLLQYIMGPVDKITASCGTVGHSGIEVEDTAAAGVEFASGAIGVIEGTTCAYPGLVSRLDIYGTEGTAILENEVLTALYLKSGEEYHADTLKDQGVNVDNTMFALQYKDIIASLQAGREITVNGHEGRKALEIILAVYKAAFTRSQVRLPLADSAFLEEIMKNGGFN
jgi:predicted dehydrogenase